MNVYIQFQLFVRCLCTLNFKFLSCSKPEILLNWVFYMNRGQFQHDITFSSVISNVKLSFFPNTSTYSNFRTPDKLCQHKINKTMQM